MAEIGSVIGDKYEIISEIAHGKMSVVYLALDADHKQAWAVKKIQKQAHNGIDELFVQSALAESEKLKTLNHSALPRIVDTIDTPETVYFVMDFVLGKSLDVLVKDEGAQPEERVLDWAKQLCEVLTYLHSRVPPVILGNIKPGNILCNANRLYLIDLSAAVDYRVSSPSGRNIGALYYAAPEVMRGGVLDERTDIYSFGANLYYMLSGDGRPMAMIPYPIQHTSLRFLNPTASAGMVAIINKCLEMNAMERFQSCTQLMAALENKPCNKHQRRTLRGLHIFGSK